MRGRWRFRRFVGRALRYFVGLDLPLHTVDHGGEFYDSLAQDEGLGLDGIREILLGLRLLRLGTHPAKLDTDLGQLPFGGLGRIAGAGDDRFEGGRGAAGAIDDLLPG